jgi:DNA replication licensing factor MCM7
MADGGVVEGLSRWIVGVVGGYFRVYLSLALAVAPDIFGFVDMKKMLILQSVGGGIRSWSSRLFGRGKIHMCMVGGECFEKSRVYRHVGEVVARSAYVDVSGGVRRGISVSAGRDIALRGFDLSYGALVTTDGGTFCLAGFDKLGESDSYVLGEVMESQSVSVTKAGVVSTLSCGCSLLAGADFLFSRFLSVNSYGEELGFSDRMVQRFDVAVVLCDPSCFGLDFFGTFQKMYLYKQR